MVAVGDTAALIQYVNSEAPSFGLDPAAVLSTAHVEGWSGLIGDGGHAYGPWQDHLTDFKERPWYGGGVNNQQVQAWAWSTEGINYVLNQMASTGKAKGLSGYNAVVNINTFYERSADIPGQIKKAWDWYKSFANGSAVGTSGSVSTVDPSLASGAAIVSGSSSSTTTTSSSGGSTFQLIPGASGPGFDWPGVKISTGFLWSAGFFILAGLLIIAGLVFAFRRQIEATAASAARGVAGAAA